MSAPSSEILYMCDEKGNVHGVYLPLEVWNVVEATVRQTLAEAGGAPKTQPLPPEPLADWNMLKEYWDFKYPVNTEVHCELCGAATQDWSADEPRKFWLKACNLGGLMTFKCLVCGARVSKKHFKDRIKFEAVPLTD